MADQPYDPFTSTTAVPREDAEVEFARVVAFSDGVFAIAITLLVLALEVPSDADDLGKALLELDDDLFAYALSFAVVGRFWLAHHRFFAWLQRFDGRLMGLNLLYLAWVVLIPFSSELLGTYGENDVAVAVYAAILVGASGTFAVQISYAFRNGLMRESAMSVERRYAGPANLIMASVFAASIPVALLVGPAAAQAMWIVSLLTGRRAADWVARRGDEVTRP